jgi:4-hydroxy-3-polyprenylbenzoate decarboxylase
VKSLTLPQSAREGWSARGAAVDVMARSSGGSVRIENSPAGKMEVAVAIGTDPAITFSAIVPAPPDVEEYLVAGFLRQKPVELVKCETVDLEVPASSEIVLEGYVNLDELRTEGPFGDHTGFYSLEESYLFDDDCGQAPHGGRLHGEGGGADFSAADETDDS